MSSHSSNEYDEIDREPEPRLEDGGEGGQGGGAGQGGEVEDAVVEIASEPKQKLNVKLVNIENFSGAIRDGYLDAGAPEWFERLQVQIDDAQILNGRTWPEPVKCSVLSNHLTGTASTWFIRNRSTLPRNSFHDLGRAFLQKFRSRLSVQRQAVLLASTTKLPHESYDEYAHRLSQIATGLNHGRANDYTEQQALSTFIQLAYPRYRDTLLAQIDVEADDAAGEMEKAINLLSRLAGSDGRMKKRRYDAVSGGGDQVKRARPGHAAIAATSNQKKPRDRWDFSNALCKICDQRGHTTNYHDRHVAEEQRKKTTNHSAGHAAAAVQSSDDE